MCCPPARLRVSVSGWKVPEKLAAAERSPIFEQHDATAESSRRFASQPAKVDIARRGHQEKFGVGAVSWESELHGGGGGVGEAAKAIKDPHGSALSTLGVERGWRAREGTPWMVSDPRLVAAPCSRHLAPMARGKRRRQPVLE
jgi:hypothetical protein